MILMIASTRSLSSTHSTYLSSTNVQVAFFLSSVATSIANRSKRSITTMKNANLRKISLSAKAAGWLKWEFASNSLARNTVSEIYSISVISAALSQPSATGQTLTTATSATKTPIVKLSTTAMATKTSVPSTLSTIPQKKVCLSLAALYALVKRNFRKLQPLRTRSRSDLKKC